MESSDLVDFRTSAPFPFEGMIPEQNKPFLDHDPDGRAFHLAPRGGKLYADLTYDDRRSLVVIPPRFDPRAPNAVLVLFFHGNQATLQRDVVERQGVRRQMLASQINGVLVAPQLAVDALDSSPGRFYEPGFLQTYLHEAAIHLAARSRFDVAAFDKLPVVIVAYSGGYLATAFILHHEGDSSRVRGIILLDALFGEDQKILSWVQDTHRSTFFVNAYSNASAPLSLPMRQGLERAGLLVRESIAGPIGPGDIVFEAVPRAIHNDFVTMAWTHDPLADVLRRIRLN